MFHYISQLSPNYNERPDGRVVDTLVLHYTGMQSAKAALARLADPASQVSAHYLVDEDGSIYQLVAENKRAWHAGKSVWRGKEALNDNSIGIEIVNPGHEFGYRPFPTIQMEAVAELSEEIISRNPAIIPRNVIAHSDIAPDRKEDPGELFDWQMLASCGIGLWPEVEVEAQPQILARPNDKGGVVRGIQQRLCFYGYGLDITKEYDTQTAKAVMAFKRHFCPETLGEHWDTLADRRLNALLEIV